MKPNYAKRNMGKNKEYRPEQFKLQEYFQVYAPTLRTAMELPISVGDQIIAVLDFADLDNKIAYRLASGVNQGSHNGKINSTKYTNQKVWLETLGWKVEDINEDSWNWNWLFDS